MSRLALLVDKEKSNDGTFCIGFRHFGFWLASARQYLKDFPDIHRVQIAVFIIVRFQGRVKEGIRSDPGGGKLFTGNDQIAFVNKRDIVRIVDMKMGYLHFIFA